MSAVIAVLGLGEAGSLLAGDLAAAGAAVRGYDPKVPAPAGVTGTGSDAEAVAGADLVLSVNSASDAVAALEASLATLRPGAVWADLNTAAPSVKQRLAAVGADEQREATRRRGVRDARRQQQREREGDGERRAKHGRRVRIPLAFGRDNSVATPCSRPAVSRATNA